MKIRNGFVSNSSSSSFLMVVKKEHYDAVINELKDIQVKFLDYVKEAKKFAGTDVYVFSIMNNMGYGTVDEFRDCIARDSGKKIEEESDEYYEEKDSINEAIYELETVIFNKFGRENVIVHSEDF